MLLKLKNSSRLTGLSSLLEPLKEGRGTKSDLSIKAGIAIGKGKEPEGVVLSKMKCGNGEKEQSVRIWLQKRWSEELAIMCTLIFPPHTFAVYVIL